MYQREYIRSLEVHIPLTCEIGQKKHTLETAILRVGYMQYSLSLFAAFRLVGSCTDSRGIQELVVKFSIYGRRDFQSALHIINWAVQEGYPLFVYTNEKRASLSENPAEFWKKMALAQMWYKDVKYDDEM